MNLLLLSLGLGAMERLVPPCRLGFVPTAGEPYPDPSFVTSDRRRLIKLGYDVVDMDISHSDEVMLTSTLDTIDALFVAGGNTFYLMQQIRRRNLVQPLCDYIASERPYIGASAGAIICGPTIEPVRTLDDPNAAPDLVDYSGLAIVDFVVLPHYGKPKYLPRYEAIEERFGSEFPLVKLRDNEAIVLDPDDAPQIIASDLILAEI